MSITNLGGFIRLSLGRTGRAVIWIGKFCKPRGAFDCRRILDADIFGLRFVVDYDCQVHH